ncbi:MAG: cyclic pyranopterin monophosphate synthase MoaC [Acidobacteriota bacterium]
MKLTHLDSRGRARMVDIGEKPLVKRWARAEGKLFVSPSTLELVARAALPKGNPFEAARIAGIQAAKETSRLIPLCHTLSLDYVDVEIEVAESAFQIRSSVACRWATGVEMEALTAVTVAALALYDMCKAVDKGMRLGEVRLVEKAKGEEPDK